MIYPIYAYRPKIMVMSASPLLVTCGLPYTNGPCHLGHLRTYVPADFYVRYMRRSGEDVVFICGSDNHGTPVVVSAEEKKISPRVLCEQYHHHFRKTFERMDVRFDHFGMTDDPTNHKRTQSIVRRLIENGHVYSQIIKQAFCPQCHRFLPDRYLEGTCPHCHKPARGDECDQGCGKHLEPGEIQDPTCTICGTRAEFREQEHFFFRLSAFDKFLDTFLSGLHGTENARNYARGWVKEGLHDWCITRTLEWGVSFPGHDDLVVYVWVDAPTGYIAFTEEWAEKNGRDWRDLWCPETSRVTHFIGGDITYHHCVFWPALLQGAGYHPPHAVVASGMLKIDDHKFSKSRGYVVWTNEDYLDRGLPSDYLRYYLLAYTSHTKELNFSWKLFQERINNEVVNTLGNFVYRTLHFAYKEFGGVPEGSVSMEIIETIRACIREVDSSVKSYEFKAAVDTIIGLAAYGNNYIQIRAPWKQIKDNREEAEQTILDCLQIAQALAILTEPVMPVSAQAIWTMIGNRENLAGVSFSYADQPIKTRNFDKPAIIFVKLEDDLIGNLEKELEERIQMLNKEPCNSSLVSIEDFAKIELKTGRVIAAEAIPKSKKLLRLQVDLGCETRQIVSGIAKWYTPDELIGTDVIVIANLQPATLCGVESRGMVLAAGEEASLLIPKKSVPPGTKIL